MKPVFPWTDAEGRPLTKTELKVASKNWNAETWESYLQSLEHRESDLVCFMEDDPSFHEITVEDFRGHFTDFAPIDSRFAKEVRAAVCKLSPKKRNLIRKSYWEGASERNLAKESGVERRSIYKQKRKAKQQLKKILLKDSKHLRSWRRQK